jgi:4-oxalocrotonate tautomerase family enzyme
MGRRQDKQKAQLVKEITEVVSRVSKTPPETVNVIIHDNPPGNTGRAGKLHHLKH